MQLAISPYIMVKQEAENRQEVRAGYRASRSILPDLHPPVRLDFLKVPQPSRVAVSSPWGQVFNTLAFGGYFTFKNPQMVTSLMFKK